MKSMCCCVIWSKIAGAHGGRRHAVDADAGARELLAERLGEADHRRLRRAVRGRVGIAFLARDRRDVDDAPVVLRSHDRHDGAVAQEHAVHVDVEHALPRLDRILGQRPTFGPVMPAEHTSTSMPPSASRRRCATRATSSALGDVDAKGVRRVAERALRAAPAPPRRDPTARRARRSPTRRCATARPMPCAPPVIAAVRPAKSS